ncbi:hypothetical protein [Meridianimarinicoccus sp. MJW13]|uniref:hypothetical protein n=1 Tax=Meridianimarinicoccus sp. MJW13 TaxID=2720031 RepID=UPI001866AF92|nr:hypothetical protein [Fluviibacterium sp. MJW13]
MRVHLRFFESEDLDPETLVACFSQARGCSRDRAAVDLVESLASRMAGLARALADTDLMALEDHAKRLQATASAAGLTRLQRAARAVAHCAAVKDHVALAATVARCRRLGEATITLLWTAGQEVE